MELKIIDGLLTTRTVNAEKRSVDAVMSTDALDRYFERIEHAAWTKRLSRFESSPVLLKDHDHTKPIGHWENVKVGKDGLTGTAIFAKTDDAEERFTLHRDGHVKGFSVGFISHKWSFKREEIDGERKDVRIHQDCELIECSSVAVPANIDAMQRLFRSVSVGGEDPIVLLKQLIDLVKKIDKDSQSLDARMPGLVADAFDLLAGRETHARLFGDPDQPGDGIDPKDDTVSPETAKALAELNARFKR